MFVSLLVYCNALISVCEVMFCVSVGRCTGRVAQGEDVAWLRGIGAGVRSSFTFAETAVRSTGDRQPPRSQGRRT